MDRILKGLSRFQKNVYPKHRDLFQKLALGQRPEAFFITCADSRIDPCMLTQTKPGDLFISRVIGNIVPPYPDAIGGVSATIEYAVGVLGVPDIIVCGHTDCGVMKGVVNPEPLEPLTSVTRLAQLRAARTPSGRAKNAGRELRRPRVLLAVTERNVVEQLANLRTHPSVIARLEQGDLRLHGWVYDLGEGVVTSYDPEKEAFVRLESPKPKLRAARRP